LNTSLLLLTDGEPTDIPPNGIVYSLKQALLEFPDRNFSINSFGFGYSLDSMLLYDISIAGDGFFGYIPDCTMVGTIFVNFLANTLSNAVKKLEIVFPDDSVLT